MHSGFEFACVYLTASHQDFEEAAGLLTSVGIQLHHAAQLDRAFSLLRSTGATAVLSDVKYRDGNWMHAREMISAFRPGMPIVVAVSDADEQFWLHQLDQGLADLVFKPFHADELRRVLVSAHQQTVSLRVPVRLRMAKTA